MTLWKLLFVLWIVIETVSPDYKLNKITSKLRVIRTVRRLDTWEDCREECINEEKCSYFRFKDHQNISQRKCSLIQMVEKIRQGWVSGPKFCGTNECKEEYTVNKILKTERIKNIESFEDCRHECQQNVKCNFINFK